MCCLGVVHTPVQFTCHTLPSFRMHRSSHRVDTLPLHSIMVVVIVACCRHPSVVVMLCWVKIRWHIHHSVATSLTWHLVLGLANSKGEGGLTLSLFIVWWPCCQLWCGDSGSCCCCLTSMWPVVWLVMWHCHIGHHVMVVGGGCYGWRCRRGEGGDEVGVHGHCGWWWWLRNKRKMDEWWAEFPLTEFAAILFRKVGK